MWKSASCFLCWAELYYNRVLPRSLFLKTLAPEGTQPTQGSPVDFLVLESSLSLEIFSASCAVLHLY